MNQGRPCSFAWFLYRRSRHGSLSTVIKRRNTLRQEPLQGRSRYLPGTNAHPRYNLVFKCRHAQNQKSKAPSKPTASSGGALPAELDFFKYAEGGNAKRKSSEKSEERDRKRAKIDDEDEEMHSDDHEESTPAPPTREMPKHRIATKGVNAPAQAASFEEMKERFSILPQVYANLAKNDYHSPTAIQAAGIPVLAEVSGHSLPLRTSTSQNCYRIATWLPYPQPEPEKHLHTSSLCSCG